jgi:predicted O-methyltransferase YrrM
VYGVTMTHYADLGGYVHGATVLEGNSHDHVTLQRLKDQLGGRPVDVLFIDGDHSLDGALADWRMYSPLVRPGGLVLLHDIKCAGEEAVAAAWEQIRAGVTDSGGSTTEIYADAGKPLGFGIARMAGDE